MAYKLKKCYKLLEKDKDHKLEDYQGVYVYTKNYRTKKADVLDDFEKELRSKLRVAGLGKYILNVDFSATQFYTKNPMMIEQFKEIINNFL